jgi:hypothetical protein
MILPGGIQNPGDPRAKGPALRRPMSGSRAEVPGTGEVFTLAGVSDGGFTSQ